MSVSITSPIASTAQACQRSILQLCKFAAGFLKGYVVTPCYQLGCYLTERIQRKLPGFTSCLKPLRQRKIETISKSCETHKARKTEEPVEQGYDTENLMALSAFLFRSMIKDVSIKDTCKFMNALRKELPKHAKPINL